MMNLMLYFSKPPTRDELNALIDKAADIIRTAVDYKFILVLLLLKRMNDLTLYEKEKARQELEKRGLTGKKLEEQLKKEEFYTFKIPGEYLWDNIKKDRRRLPENLADAISAIAKMNESLQGVINRIDFLEFARNEENRAILSKLVDLFDKYYFAGNNLSPDVFGDAYEHILMKFAPEKAKEGEIYTPREVISLLVNILDPKPEYSIYDPCCGSGGMLIISYNYVKDKYGSKEVNKLNLYGQERNADIYAICRMNLLLHGINDHNIVNGDTLMRPRFLNEGKRFDVVIANPPWNQDGYDEDSLKEAELKQRFKYGYTPSSSADWLWIQHMLFSTDEKGKVGIVIDNGALFRGNAEKAIREKIVRDDLVESVILLPEKLFYNTGAPGAVIIFNKDKPKERKGKILFINASNEYIKHPSVRRLNSLSHENIKHIADAYREFKDISGFCRVVSIEEVKAKDYNLNVTLYVMPTEDKEAIDIKKEWEELEKLEMERQEINNKLKEYISGITQAIYG